MDYPLPKTLICNQFPAYVQEEQQVLSLTNASFSRYITASHLGSAKEVTMVGPSYEKGMVVGSKCVRRVGTNLGLRITDLDLFA